MASSSTMMNAPEAARTLTPLPPEVHRGSIAVVVFACLSLTATTSLVLHLAFRILTWKHRAYARINQYVALLLNLILADMQQSIGFALNLQWLHHNSITALSPTCWTQAWLLNVGDVGSAVFTLAMACHLFADVVFDYRLDYTAFLAAMIAFWTFTYFCSTIGVIVHPSDFFMRAGMWCWISEKYMAERLWLHYVWILATEFGVVVIYALMFVVLWRRIRKFFYVSDDRQVRAESAARSVVVYPAVYVLCTLPAVIARLKMMAGGKVGVKELTVVGVLMTSNGWLDCLVYALTRKSLIFGPAIQNDGVHGLETFTSWQQYPEVQEMDCWSPKTESNDGAIGKTPEMMQSSRSGDESTENLFQGKWHVENGRIVDTEAFPSKASFPMRSVRSDSDLRKSAGTRFPRRKDPCKKIADYEIQHKAQHEFAQAEPVADLGVIRRDANNILRTEQADTAIREQDVLEIEECPPSALHSQSPPEMKTVKFRSSSLDPKSPGRA